jgi:hypothetical protein
MNTQKSNFFSNILPELFNDWDEEVSYSSDITYMTSKGSTIYWSSSSGCLVGWF